jgi:hypothetical protein
VSCKENPPTKSAPRQTLEPAGGGVLAGGEVVAEPSGALIVTLGASGLDAGG